MVKPVASVAWRVLRANRASIPFSLGTPLLCAASPTHPHHTLPPGSTLRPSHDSEACAPSAARGHTRHLAWRREAARAAGSAPIEVHRQLPAIGVVVGALGEARRVASQRLQLAAGLLRPVAEHDPENVDELADVGVT